MAIVYSVDSYGSDARLSATADFIELLALGGRSITLADLADFLSDAQVRRLGHERMVVGGGEEEWGESSDAEGTAVEGDDDLGPSREVARSVMNLIEQRSIVLGDKYPFVFGAGDGIAHVHLRPASVVEDSPYVGLLALTTAHAYQIDTGVDVTQAFEDTVARAMRARIPRTVHFGGMRRSVGFDKALKQAGVDLMLPTTLKGVVLSTAIKDGGADTLAHLDWGDSRIGRWTFVGQVTCGRSDSWESKANEANRGKWRVLLGDVLRPSPFLAVPHHVEDLMLRRLVEDSQTLVLDRLRIVPYLSSLSVDERRVAERIRETTVEYL